MTGVPGVGIVTGAASGIGEATAKRLAGEGISIALLDTDPAGLDRVAADIEGAGGHCSRHLVDVRDSAAVARVLEEASGALGSSGLLVNVAGIGVAARLHETSLEDWDRVLAVNLRGVFNTCRAVLEGMMERGGGVIVNVASVAGVVGVRNRAAYCASKAGVIGLTRSIAVDYAASGIRANAICPGTVASPWIGKILADAPDPLAARQAMEARQLDGRMGTPEEVAAGIAFLASPEARFVNGSAFVMDGGMSAI